MCGIMSNGRIQLISNLKTIIPVQQIQKICLKSFRDKVVIIILNLDLFLLSTNSMYIVGMTTMMDH